MIERKIKTMPRFKLYSSIACVSLISLLALVEAQGSIAVAATSLQSQEKEAVWERYSAKEEEFSVMMPELPGVISGQTCLDLSCQTVRLEKTYAAYSDGVVYIVTSYQTPHLRPSLEAIIDENLSLLNEQFKIVSQSDVTLNKFKGKRYVLMSKPDDHDRIVTFYLTNKYVYRVDAVGETENDSSMKKFIESFALDNKKATDIGNGAKQITTSLNNPLQARTNQSSQSVKPGQMPETSGGLGPGRGGNAGQTEGGGGRGGNIGGGSKSSQTPRIFKPSEVTRKAMIVLKPSPEYTEEARQKEITGRVILQLVFSSTGGVVNIRTIGGLPHGLTENAIRAARVMYFIPAMKDGKRVPQYARVEYNFNIY